MFYEWFIIAHCLTRFVVSDLSAHVNFDRFASSDLQIIGPGDANAHPKDQ